MIKGEKIIIIVFSSFYLIIFIIELILFLFKIKVPKFSLKKILIINLVLILIGLLGLLTLTHTNYLDYEKPIPYSEYNRIGFKNFRGIELFKKKFNGSKYFAYVVTTIELDKENNSIVAYFHPSKSFVYNKKSSSSDLLTHELYHFKITEIFARKTRKEIIEKNIINFDEKERVLIKNLIDEDIFQKKYDFETFHSYVYSKQKEFERTIDSLLITLNKYKNPELK
ncbi:hypothetical protein [Flavobacterium dankookense]|uniref:Uncharacterized protein n=1 Tax=Flavobacterium dankookense TaxID=706186 RepID=A0A4R6Q6B0_9FLAO|nr:hypothetical protein [Flavobacterium dankookense]TDP57565.1 hypothetical protein BC748_2778 [Flavobacterium dankookense]